jgi:hypothetical protein
MKNGRLPARVVAYLKPEQESGDYNWCGFPNHARETPKFSKFMARPAFIVPDDSDAFKATAGKWASETEYGGTAKAFDTHGFDNEPFTDLRWVGIESRKDSGVVYKVLTPEGWLVDLRQDVVIECLLEGDIKTKNWPQGIGTYFTAEFIWVVMGSQSRLVRVGSKLYEEIMESQVLRGMGPISERDLEVGGIYQKSNGNEVVIIDLGMALGRKFLVMEGRSSSSRTIKARVLESLPTLDHPNGFPAWHWCGSLKVMKQNGKMDLPIGLGEKWDQKVSLDISRYS